MKVKFFTTHCPKCAILKKKLDEKQVEYEEVDNVDDMLSLGLKSAPALQLDDDKILNFMQSVAWANTL